MNTKWSVSALLWFVVAVFSAGANAQLTTSALLASADRAALAASGKVDPRLLDALEQNSEVNVLVTFHEAPMAPGSERGDAAHQSAIAARCEVVLAPLSRSEFSVTRRFATLPGFAGTVNAAGLSRFVADAHVAYVALDGGGRGSLSESVPLTNTDNAQNFGVGYSGAGIRVAVIDSGIDTDHADLADSIVEERCWCSGPAGAVGCCPAGADTQTGAGSAEDDHGHGTHVAGVIASNGLVASEGAAPDVDIVALKVLDSSLSFSVDSDVLAALSWLDSQGSPGNPYVDIVNMSLETATKFSEPCDSTSAVLWATAINNLRTDGTLVISAAGNQGSGDQGASQFLPAPACVSTSFTVAASYDTNFASVFWPPALGGSLGCTDAPAAPDDFICSSNANTFTDIIAPGFQITSSWNDGLTMNRGGTSQAAPAVAGCAALLLEADPSVSLTDLETFLETSATSIDHPVLPMVAYPRLDCEAALVALPEAAGAAPIAATLLSLCALARRRRRP